MQVRYFREWSSQLNRMMEFKMYGHSGKLCLVIPCQNCRFFEWEDRQMFDLVSEYIDNGSIQFVTCDTIDTEAWSSHGSTYDRMRKQEAWNNYIVQELMPSALYKAGLDAQSTCMVTGASLGASHAANLAFRYPYLFDQCLALSGLYDFEPAWYYDAYRDEFSYNNNPCAYLSNLDPNHPYAHKYSENQIIICCGQGNWEQEGLETVHRLKQILDSKNIHIWIDIWGQDVYHDWPWWETQLKYFIPKMIEWAYK